MANVRYTTPILDIVGSHGATTFQRFSSGPGIRTRTKTRQPRTYDQELRRYHIASHSWAWANSRTDAQRATWNALAAITDWVNSSGEIYHPSGRALYLRQAILAPQLGAIARTIAPYVADITPPTIKLSISGGWVRIDDFGGAALTADTALLLHRSTGQILTRYYPTNCNDYAYHWHVTGPPATPFNLHTTASLTIKRRYFYQFRYFQYSAEPDPPYTNKDGTCSFSSISSVDYV